MKEVPENKRRNAVARIIGDQSTYSTEAQRLGVNVRTLKRWVKAVKEATPEPQKSQDVPVSVPQDVPVTVMSPIVTPQEKCPPNPVLDKLLEEEKVTTVPGDKDKALSPAELAVGRAESEEFCIQAYGGIRAAAGAVLVHATYTPPLDPSSPEVLRLLEVGAIAKTAIRANAPKLYPILVKYAGTWSGLVLALGADAYGMIMGLQALAQSKGWQPKEKDLKRREKPKADVPSPKQYGESLAPKPAAPSASSSSSKDSMIVDAPLPPTAAA